MTLADLLVPGSGDVKFHFVDEGLTLSYGAMWERAGAVAAWNMSRGSGPTAMVLSNTSACATTLIGAIAAGMQLVSVPLPPRGGDLEWYASFVQHLCTQSGAAALVVDRSLLPLLPPLNGVQYSSFEDILEWKGTGASNPDRFVLTQFTSGSTADPKGVVLDEGKIRENVEAILTWLAPAPGDGSCSWLPLSHDMGLIGMFLTSIAGAGDGWARGGDIVLMTPEGFLRNPAGWLEACCSFGSTITSAPNFGFEVSVLRRRAGLDLSRLRVCITGAEPVRAETLDRFASAFGSDGFDSRAFCPAYGLAELALAVTVTEPSTHWHAVELDPRALADRLIVSGSSGTRLVSSGHALQGYDVKIDEGEVGEILVRGPSLGDMYADGQPVRDGDGWFHTRDLGFLDAGALYVVGRIDDVFQVAGRNIYAVDIEMHVSELGGIRQGRVVAVLDSTDALTIVAECEPNVKDPLSVKGLATTTRDLVARRVGVAPRTVLLVERGTLPMTSSGKTQRGVVRDRLASGGLAIMAGSLGTVAS